MTAMILKRKIAHRSHLGHDMVWLLRNRKEIHRFNYLIESELQIKRTQRRVRASCEQKLVKDELISLVNSAIVQNPLARHREVYEFSFKIVYNFISCHKIRWKASVDIWFSG